VNLPRPPEKHHHFLTAASRRRFPSCATRPGSTVHQGTAHVFLRKTHFFFFFFVTLPSSINRTWQQALVMQELIFCFDSKWTAHWS